MMKKALLITVLLAGGNVYGMSRLSGLWLRARACAPFVAQQAFKAKQATAEAIKRTVMPKSVAGKVGLGCVLAGSGYVGYNYNNIQRYMEALPVRDLHQLDDTAWVTRICRSTAAADLLAEQYFSLSTPGGEPIAVGVTGAAAKWLLDRYFYRNDLCAALDWCVEADRTINDQSLATIVQACSPKTKLKIARSIHGNHNTRLLNNTEFVKALFADDNGDVAWEMRDYCRANKEAAWLLTEALIKCGCPDEATGIAGYMRFDDASRAKRKEIASLLLDNLDYLKKWNWSSLLRGAPEAADMVVDSMFKYGKHFTPSHLIGTFQLCSSGKKLEIARKIKNNSDFLKTPSLVYHLCVHNNRAAETADELVDAIFTNEAFYKEQGAYVVAFCSDRKAEEVARTIKDPYTKGHTEFMRDEKLMTALCLHHPQVATILAYKN